MAKVKKRNYDKTNRQQEEILSKETQYALIGILLFLVCVIGMINNGGQAGYIIRYIFVFLTGFFNIFFFAAISVYGLLLFIRRKRPKVKINLIFGACITLFTFSLIASSANDFTLAEAVNKYIRIFNSTHKLDPYDSSLGGGFIGFLAYAALREFVGVVGVKIICAVFILASIFVILRNPLYHVVDRINKVSSKKTVKKKKPKVEKEARRFFNDDEAAKEIAKQQQELEQIEEVFPIPPQEFDVFASPLDFEGEKETPIPEVPKAFDVFSMPLFVDEDIPLYEEEKEEIDEEIIPPQAEEIIPPQAEEIIAPFDLFEEEKEEEIPPLNLYEQLTTPNEPLIQEQVREIYRPREEKPVVVGEYVLPPLSLLNPPLEFDRSNNIRIANQFAEKLEEKFAFLGVKAHIEKIVFSPTITRFVIKPDPDYSISNLGKFRDDFRMVLETKSVNLVIPIPGQPYAGIEMPNTDREIVNFRTTIIDSTNKPLTYVPLGRDLEGQTIGFEIIKAPHVLIAGATNSGKSVCLNTIIASLVMRTRPEQVKMIIVDPKCTEFGIFSRIPHLACPIIKDAKSTLEMLTRILEMMRMRNELLSEVGERNLTAYNKKMALEGRPQLDYYVVIIDEFADIFMGAKSFMNDTFMTLGQMARSAGIHLIIATQRPSTDVITGTIKNNFTCRVALSVPSVNDSRTIIDSGGAENLLGNGDMFLMIPGIAGNVRAQGTYIDDDEIRKIVDYTAKFNAQKFNPFFLDLDKDEEELAPVDDKASREDDLRQMILILIRKDPSLTTNSVSMKLNIPYAKAGRLLAALENDELIYRDSNNRWVIND